MTRLGMAALIVGAMLAFGAVAEAHAPSTARASQAFRF
jgi:hypothetical protein